MIVKNCLPCNISIKVSQNLDIDSFASFQQIKNSGKDETPIENYELLRGEEKYLSQIQQTTSEIGV
jgi:hypothetical protein